jgi:hypothetical protein
MMMKNFLWICLILFFCSCSNKYESVLNSAPKPSILFNKDTLRIREKDYTNINRTDNGTLTLYCPNAGHQLNIVLSDTSGKVHFFYRGGRIQNGQPLIAMDSVQLFATCDTAGIYPVDFLLTDQLGRIDQRTLVVKCAPNQKANPSFFYVAEPNEQQQSWSYLFEGSISNDPDGSIVSYTYSINGQLISTNQPSLHFTFHAKGEHTIGLFVIDDLGLHSDTLYKKLIIQ